MVAIRPVGSDLRAALAFSPDGRTLPDTGEDRVIRLRNVRIL
ncbi:hypothetical protein [Streptomyces sp. HUAS TT7]